MKLRLLERYFAWLVCTALLFSFSFAVMPDNLNPITEWFAPMRGVTLAQH